MKVRPKVRVVKDVHLNVLPNDLSSSRVLVPGDAGLECFDFAACRCIRSSWCSMSSRVKAHRHQARVGQGKVRRRSGVDHE